MDRLVDTTIGAHLIDGWSPSAPLSGEFDDIVVGGGIIGTSIAAHLTAKGRKVLLLEANILGSGTTWHAAGLCTASRSTIALTKLAKYGIEFYSQLEAKTGIDVAFDPVGSLMIARTPGRVDEAKYAADVALMEGVEARLLSPDEAGKVWSPAATEDVLAALHIPGDGHLNPGYAAIAMAKLAFDQGATVLENTRVTGFLMEDGVIAGVRTENGEFRSSSVTLAAGLWTRDLAALANVPVALYAAEHLHVRSAPVGAAPVGNEIPRPPVFRDLDNHFYIRGENEHLLVGAFEPDGIPRETSEISTDGFATFPDDWNHFAPIRAKAEDAVPLLRDTELQRFLNAPESFTPDGNFLVGETAEISGLFVAAGFNSQGIIFAPGVGKEMAEWIVSGSPKFDASSVDVRRYSRHQVNEDYLHERTKEGLGRLYAMHWPHLQPVTARDVRRSVLHDRLLALGAHNGELNGWERATWYGDPGTAPKTEYSYGRQNWFDRRAAEHEAARNGVALFDLSSFAKIELNGPEALAVLQQEMTADMDQPVGKAIYTLALNEAGGIELDGTVVRLEDERFWFIVPAFARDLAFQRLKRAARGKALGVFDATSGLATIAVMGPKSRELLQSVSSTDIADAALPYMYSKEIDLGGGRVTALRISFVGELGYELYVPAELAVTAFDALWAAGQNFGLKLAGYNALDSLRAEKGFRHLGHDIGPNISPREAGLGFTVSKVKDFVGSESLRRNSDAPAGRKTMYVKLENPEALLYHDEGLYRDGQLLGEVTSGSYGHTLGAAVGIALVKRETDAGPVLVRIKGQDVPAVLSAKPFYDPTGSRMKG